jgi:hypothetical protein
LLAQSPGALHYSTAELIVVRWEQGRMDEVEDPLRELYERTRAPVWRAAMAVLAGETNNPEAARADLDALTEDRCAAVPFDGNWLAALYFLSMACLHVGESARASELSALLEPYRGRVAVLGAGAACLGPVSHALGVLAALRGERTDAMALFEEAAETSRTAGSEPWLARANLQLGMLLGDDGNASDRQRADQLVAESAATAQRLGMGRLLRISQQAQAAVKSRA